MTSTDKIVAKIAADMPELVRHAENDGVNLDTYHSADPGRGVVVLVGPEGMKAHLEALLERLYGDRAKTKNEWAL